MAIFKKQQEMAPKPIIVDKQLKIAPLKPEWTRQYFELVVKNQDRLDIWFSWAKQEQTLRQTREYLEQVVLEHKNP